MGFFPKLAEVGIVVGLRERSGRAHSLAGFSVIPEQDDCEPPLWAIDAACAT